MTLLKGRRRLLARRPRLHLLGHFRGPNGAIRVLEETATGVRLYEEGGVAQSRVRAGGEADVAYVRLMAALLEGNREVLLLGCGGGSLATMLHRGGTSVTAVDSNPISFALARTFFWMPPAVSCVTSDARAFLCRKNRTFDAVGIDVGGPRFSYTSALGTATVAGACRALRSGGRIAINISHAAPDDPVPARIAARFAAQGLDVWLLSESMDQDEVNTVILASDGVERPSELLSCAGEGWSLARLAMQGRSRTSRGVLPAPLSERRGHVARANCATAKTSRADTAR